MDSADDVRPMRNRDFIGWLYGLSLDESLTPEEFRQNARGALAQHLGEPPGRPEPSQDEADA